MLFWVRSCTFLLVYCLSTLCLTRPRSTLDSRWKNTQPLCPLPPHPKCLFHSQSIPFQYLLQYQRRLRGSGSRFTTTSTHSNTSCTSKTLSITLRVPGPYSDLTAAFLSHGLCYAYAKHKRNIGETPLIRHDML